MDIMTDWRPGIFLFGILLFGSGAAEAKTCGVLEQVDSGSQVIPRTGSIRVRLKTGDAVPCDSMVLARLGGVRILLEDRSVVKLAPGTFIELQGPRKHSLYRGEILLTGPVSKEGSAWTTPNSVIRFQGGVAWVEYVPAGRMSSIAVFNRQVRFMNRFNPEAWQDVAAGETSKLLIQEARVRPSQPEVMHPTSVAPLLARFGLPAEEVKEFLSIVKKIHSDRSEALASEIEEWNESAGEESGRAPASVGASGSVTVDPKEAEFVMGRLRERLYGKPEEVARIENDRRPASPRVPPVFSDEEYESSKKRLGSEVKRVGKAIDSIRLESPEE
jgi:hypothetical protein